MAKQQMDDPTPKEATKTWGFRRSTIAKREFIEEIGSLDLFTPVPRRNTRQPKGRGRGRGRGQQARKTMSNASKSARGCKRTLQESDSEPEPDSEDLITASRQLSLQQRTTSDIQASEQAEDSDELTLRQLQERVRQQATEENSSGGVKAVDLSAEAVNKDNKEAGGLQQSEGNLTSVFDRMATCSLVITERRKPARGVQDEEEQEKQTDADESSDGEGEYSDPNAVYCICRQKHNDRQVAHSSTVFCSSLECFRFLNQCSLEYKNYQSAD